MVHSSYLTLLTALQWKNQLTYQIRSKPDGLFSFLNDIALLMKALSLIEYDSGYLGGTSLSLLTLPTPQGSQIQMLCFLAQSCQPAIAFNSLIPLSNVPE